MKTFTAVTPDDLQTVAKEILADLHMTQSTSATTILLEGELGAGKTAFTKALGVQLGVTETIVSPTFVVMKQYDTTDERFSSLVHIDAYRLADETETTPLHLHELFKKPNTLVCIEWASLIQKALPSNHAAVAITSDEAGVRTITYRPYGNEKN